MTHVELDSATDELMGQIVDDYVDRLGRGEAPDVEDYALRHPELASVLRQMLPALALVHASSAGAGARTAEDTLQPEGLLGDFRLVREVGRGGMGVVYEASQISLGRTVALKVLPFAGAMDRRQLQRFQNEARAAASLEHPHIVPIYAVGCERGVHFYAMKFIDGASLETLLHEMRPTQRPAAPGKTNDPDATGAGPPRPDDQAERDTVREPRGQASTRPSPGDKRAYFRRVAELGVEAARGLEHAHEVGVMHRDIKPANLLLDGQGKVWITDFGLAQIRADTRLTMTGDLVGTLRYMSPEQALAKRVIVDHRTDIYSLGATLYELLTLAPVYAGGDRHELLRQIAFEEPKPTRRHNPAIPLELDTIILKALEKSPADRYATAKEMADDLQRFMKDEPIWARPPSLARRARNVYRRHSAAVRSAAAVLTVSLVILAGAIGWIARDRENRLAEANRQRIATERDVQDDLNEAALLQRQEKWADVGQALERARGRLAGSGLKVLDDQLQSRRRELALVLRLEEAQLQAAQISIDGERDYPAGDKAYEGAFVEDGLAIDGAPAVEIARQIRASTIATQLIAALEYWAFVKDRMPGGNGESLRAIARLADDDPWRQRLRDPKLAKNVQALTDLAEAEGILAQPPMNLLLLFYLLDPGIEGSSSPAENATVKKARAAAVELLRRAQERSPANFWINFELGTRLAGNPDAIGFLRVALALQSQNSLVYNNLGVALSRQQKLPDAEAAFQKAIEFKPEYALAHDNLGSVLTRTKRLTEAILAHQRAIDLKSNFAEAHFNLAVALYHQKNLADAAVATQNAIDLKPGFIRALLYLGIIRNETRKPFEAETIFKNVIGLQPNSCLAYYGLGTAYVHQKKLSQAEEAFQKAIELLPNDTEAHKIHGRDFVGPYIRLGDLLNNQRRGSDAEAIFQKAIVIQPNSSHAYVGLGTAFDYQQKWPQAEEALRNAIDLQPDNAVAYNNLGNTYARQQKLPDAVAAFRKAIDFIPEYALAYSNLGNALRHLNKMPDAEEAYHKAIKFEPTNPAFHEDLGFVLTSQRKWPQAVDAFTTSIGLKSDKAAAYVGLGHALMAQDQNSDALVALTKAIDLNDSSHFTLFNAARLALLISGNQGDDFKLDSAERNRLRGRALVWLQARLAIEKTTVDKSPKAPPSVLLNMQCRFAANPAEARRFFPVLGKLPEAERQPWRKFWEDVEQCRKRATPRGFIQTWLVLSEFLAFEGTDDAMAHLDKQQIPDEAQLRPHAGNRVTIDGKERFWKEHQSAEPYIDFAALYDARETQMVVYAVCYLHAEVARNDLVLYAGSDDLAAVYVNGKQVYRHTKGRILTLDEDTAPITLLQGSNVIVFKVVNGGGPGPYGSLRLATKDGAPVEGVEYRLTP